MKKFSGYSFVILLFIILSIGCKKDEKVKITEFADLEVTNISAESASISVHLLQAGDRLINYGFCYGTTPGPTVDDYKTVYPADSAKPGIFTVQLTDLNPYKTYYIRTYAEENVIRYGEDEISFSTDDLVLNFEDANFEQAVRNALNKPEGDIYASDVNQITEFSSEGIHSIISIEGIQYFTELEILYLDGNKISDISYLSGLANLITVSLGSNQISDISSLSGLANLITVSLNSNQISDISSLSGLANLIHLRLYSNQISDISSLSGLTNLTYLLLSGNQISDISPISGLENLTTLTIGNQISDISPLSGLMNLTALVLDENEIYNVSPLSGLTNLTFLYLYNNNIYDISPLSGLTNLYNLDLRNNQISDISALSGLTNMFYLDLGDNQIIDIYPLIENSGMDNGDELKINDNPLNSTSINDYIPELQARGVYVSY
jgi:hypothetical protein